MVAAVVHGNVPLFLCGLLHQLQCQLPAPDGGDVAQAVHVHGLARVVRDVVGVQVQLRAVDEVQAGGQDRVLLALEGVEKLRGHGRLDAHAGDVALRQPDVLDHLIRAVRRAKVEAQLIQARLAQHLQVLLVGQRAVGIHVLVDAVGVEAADDALVDPDFHEGLEIDVGHARGRVAHAEQKVHVLLAHLRAADLPQALADGRLAVQLAVVVAEAALDVALVRLADGAQARAQQAGFAAPGELLSIACVQRAALKGLKAGDLRQQNGVAVRHGLLDLGEHRVDDLLLVGQQLLALRQGCKEFEPGQRVPL